MWAAVRLFFSANMARVIELFAALLAGVAVVIGIFQAGKRSAKVEELQQINKQVGQAHAIENSNRADLADGAAAGKLRTDWSR